jgi:hypothetical protein
MSTAPQEPRVEYAEDMPDRERVRAILKAGERAEMWRTVGQHEGCYVIIRDGKTEVLTVDEVLRIPHTYFLDTFGP